MDLDEYQRSALRTINPALDARDRLLDAGAGLCEEAAEVLGLIRKRLIQGRTIDDAKLAEELGDALWCLAVTAHELGIPLSKVAEGNRAKLAHRHPTGFDQHATREPDSRARSASE